jgi:KUP system potassium uptake protein
MAMSTSLSQMAETSATISSPNKSRFWVLTLGAIGVVYGDIGTSPLYALREAVRAASGDEAVSQEAVMGVLSLIIWALIIIVTAKYVLFLLRADNRGEGGTMSLMALVENALGKRTPVIMMLGMAGAALFYGDALITPAISVISAVEGLELATPAFGPYVVPLTAVILIALFAVQSRGTARVAALFGPITLVWFVAIAATGIAAILENPAVLAAFSPSYAITFLASHGVIGLITLGAVFLAVTGAEALYADLGHFGRRPIQVAWIALVFPALVANYLGQGALVLSDPAAMENPFYRLVPDWGLLPMIVLATAATVIASQAVITGAYSLTQQAVQLGLLPRFEVRHTSASERGQIYLPRLNTLLLAGVLFLVVMFESSSRLATAYGIAVTGTMVVTCCLAFLMVVHHWRWPVWLATSLIVPFLAIDCVFLLANLAKVAHGGWVPLLIAAAIMLVMYTWVRGNTALVEKAKRTDVSLDDLMRQITRNPPQQVPGTAVFLTADPSVAPKALLHSLKHYKVIHESNVILTVRFENQPFIGEEERVVMKPLSPLFFTVLLRFGYMESPNIPQALAICRKLGWKFDIMQTSFFLSRRSVRPSAEGGMPDWQDKLFATLLKNASDASSYFQIPTSRAVEIGAQVVV